jgi:hypothetical protein
MFLGPLRICRRRPMSASRDVSIPDEIRRWVEQDRNASPDDRWDRRDIWGWLIDLAARIDEQEEAGR